MFDDDGTRKERFIAGLKLIKHTGHGEIADDPTYAYRLYVNLSPPEMMQVAFIMLHGGSEEVVIRSKTREAIDQFITENALTKHPRLRRIVITGPDTQEVIQGRMSHLATCEDSL